MAADLFRDPTDWERITRWYEAYSVQIRRAEAAPSYKVQLDGLEGGLDGLALACGGGSERAREYLSAASAIVCGTVVDGLVNVLRSRRLILFTQACSEHTVRGATSVRACSPLEVEGTRR